MKDSELLSTGKSSDSYPTQYWHVLEDGRVVCDVCPRHCSLREGKRGACFVRKAENGKIVLTTYGRSSGFCIDPIEKKPLNHFYPGSSVLSFGTAGCNLGCKFCQNWSISKSHQMDTLADKASPEKLALATKQVGCDSIAFTYNDPVIFLEYAINTAIACREQGIHPVAVSAGYMCDKPREEFYSVMDAVNIDLKAFTERFYQKVCLSQLAPVLETLKYLKQETDVWFEITTLLIPDENDSDEEIDAMTAWIVDNLGDQVPLHFSAFHPDFKMMDKPRTPASTLLRAREIAVRNGLKFVYVGNVHHAEASSTYCPDCGSLLIERDWYKLGTYDVSADGHCQQCGTQIAGRFTTFSSPFGPRRIPVRFK
ncbi:AmmeMemoRadiSam system radical SAM enzyme [Veronia pacifica]|uniref:AmmeMemoRadiSam system radical SAM enzyme n=1 Tax=Veronia pacifica TaxID=1080227 RepID=A0A1C3EL08_9GAMM|nr:AmmeMemoRadiSam system radical SAM enzyme [Veronia pacifica]ODA33905.1 AmmeMemoRadiSam system radical SAM enzyme [Veronia pacifica]